MNPGLLFPQDKNYMLKEAQENTKTALLGALAENVRNTYLHDHNPLGLEDDTIKEISSCTDPAIENLENFYHE